MVKIVRHIFDKTHIADFSVMVSVFFSVLIFGIHTLSAETASTTTSSVQTFATVSDTTPPTPPTALTVGNVTSGGVTLIWQVSIDPVVSGQENSGLKEYWIFKNGEPNVFAKSSLNYTLISGLSPATSYYFKVVAVDQKGNISGTSNPVQVLTLGTTSTSSGGGSSTTTTSTTNETSGGSTDTISTTLSPDTTPPNVPLNLFVSNLTNNGFTLNWQGVEDVTVTGQTRSGLKGYKIFKDNGTSPISYSTINSYTVKGLVSGTSYVLFVSAFDSAGNNSIQSKPIYVTIPLETVRTETATTTTATTTTTVPATTQALQYISIDPGNAGVGFGANILFKAKSASTGTLLNPIWSVYESNGGSINSSGIYRSPNASGTFHVVADYPGYIRAVATVVVNGLANPTTSVNPVSPTVIKTEPIKTPAIANPAVIQKPTTNPTPTAPIKTLDKTIVRPETSNQIVPRAELVPATPTTTLAVQKLQDITGSLDDIRETISDGKKRILEIVDDKISKTLNETPSDTKNIESIRKEIINQIDLTLLSTTTLSTEDARILELKISEGLNKIDNLSLKIGEKPSINASPEVGNILKNVSTEVEDKSKDLKEQGIDLLYKDSNHDGISDYESVYLYNIDPVKPTPVTTVGGRKITAGEKVAMGYDPAQAELVRVQPEDPSISFVPATKVYKVNEVSLNPEKKVVVKGKALPNSFITVYIYSTPIVVVVKTDENGDWQYTLDKELESGDHRIYTASVSNSGKIVAKSDAFTFVKTAEAATLDQPLPFIQTSESEKPGLLNNGSILIIFIIIFAIIAVFIAIIGLSSKNNAERAEQVPPER